MTDDAALRHELGLMRLLAALLTVLWAVIAVTITSAYRPGGAIDIVVALACLLPAFVAAIGVAWPPRASGGTDRAVLVWAWLLAVLFAIPILYGVALSLAGDGPRSLVPSLESAYGGAVALFLTAWFSVVGAVHRRRRVELLERRASLLAVGLAAVLTLALGLGFLFVALVNDQAHRETEPAASRFGPTDPEVIPPFCDQTPRLGRNAVVRIEAWSSLDDIERGRALVTGERGGRDERWSGSWRGLDGQGRQAYRRVGAQAWINDLDGDPGARGTAWRAVQPDPFELFGARDLTLDGPPHAVVAVPRGAIVAEDLGLELVEDARARHCRTFIDGPMALDTFLPLRWLLLDSSAAPSNEITRWRGELDWWVFGDGEMGMASVEVSGPRSEVDWDGEGTRVVLAARLEAVDRDRRVDISAPAAASTSAPASPSAEPTPSAKPSASAGTASSPALESGAP